MNSVPPFEGKELAARMAGVFGFVPNLDYALGAEPAVPKVNGFANHQRRAWDVCCGEMFQC